MSANTEMIDQLVSPQALKDLDALDRKLITSYEEMEKTLVVVQKLNVEFGSLGKSYRDVSKFAEETEKNTKKATKAFQDEAKAKEDIQKVNLEVIQATKEQTKATQEQTKATKGELDALKSNATNAIDSLKRMQESLKKAFEMPSSSKDANDKIQSLSGGISILINNEKTLKEALKEGVISQEAYKEGMLLSSESAKILEERMGLCSEAIKKTSQSEKESKDVMKDAEDAFSKRSDTLQDVTMQLVDMNVKLNETRVAQKELDKDYSSGGISLDEYIQKKAQLNALEIDQSDAVKNLSKELQLNLKIANTVEGTYDNLSARYSLMKIEINALVKAGKENTEEHKDMQKAAAALYEEMNKLQKATGKSQLQVGDYTLANKELTGALNTVSPALGGAVSGIQAMTKASLAFLATPIGVFLALIAAGLATLSAWFTRTEEGQSALAVGTAAFERVLASILNVASDVGEWLFKAFDSPKESLKELVDFIQENLMNRLKAIGLIGESIVTIFSGDFSKGFKDLGNAVLQATSGVENMIDKTADWMNETYEGAQRAAAIQRELNDLAVKKRDLTLDESKNLAEMNKLRNIANDQEKSASERLAANNKYMEISNKLEERKVGIAKEELELRRAQIEEEKQGREMSSQEKDELAKLEANMYKVEAEHSQKMFTATRTNNQLRKEGINAAKEAMRERNKELKAIGELESFNYRKSADLQQQIFKDATIGYDERRDALESYITDEKRIIEIKRDEEVKQDGLTETQKKLIREKASYEIFKLEQKLAEETKNLKIKQAETEVKQVQDAISERSETMNQAMQDDLVTEAKNYEKQIKLNVDNAEKREKITEDYQKRRMEIIRKYNQDVFEYEVEQLEKVVDNTKLSEEKKLEIYKKIDDLKKKNAKEMADFEIQQTEEKVDKMLTAEEKFNKVLNDKRTQAIMTMWNMALDMSSMYYDEQLKQIDALEKREREYYDEKIAMIDENVQAGLMSEEEADARKRILEEAQIEREKQYEEQRKQIQQKQAKWEKANSIVQAGINTAVAVTKALPNLILAGIIGAMGAAQIAMIAAQSIPAYAKGTDYHPGGLALVGDGGRSEMVILPSGEVLKTPDTDTFVNLPRGTEVLPDYKAAMMNIGTHPNMSYYDDDSGKMVLMNDEVLRKNTKEANNQLSKLNNGINAIRYNNIHTNRLNNSGYRTTNNRFKI